MPNVRNSSIWPDVRDRTAPSVESPTSFDRAHAIGASALMSLRCAKIYDIISLPIQQSSAAGVLVTTPMLKCADVLPGGCSEIEPTPPIARRRRGAQSSATPVSVDGPPYAPRGANATPRVHGGSKPDVDRALAAHFREVANPRRRGAGGLGPDYKRTRKPQSL